MAPSVDSVADSKSGRVLGTTEENWTRAAAAGTGVQVVGIALKKNVDVKIISQAAREVQGQYAVLRTQIVVTPKGKLAYTAPEKPIVPAVDEFLWPSLENKSITDGVLVLPGDDSPDHKLSLTLASIAKQELNAPFRNASGKISGPLDVFRIHVYTEQESRRRTVIIIRINGGPLDRPSASNIAQSFITALNAVVDGKLPELPEAPGKDEILPPFEDLIPKGKAVKSLFQKGLDTVSYAMSANKFALFPFNSEFVEPKQPAYNSEILTYTLGKEGTAALFARSNEEKTTYGAALSAAFLKATANVKELKDKKLDKFGFTTLMDCRPYFEPEVGSLGLGNYTAGITQDEQVKSDTSFWDLARSVSASTEKELGKLKQFTELPVLNMLFGQVLKRPSLTQKTSLRTALFSVFVDGPLDAQWKNVDKLDLAGTFGPCASMHGLGPCFCLAEAVIPGPELTLTLVFPNPVYRKDQMEALSKSSLEILNAAIKQ
ncbi:unnamed protein product [Calypogeia fissa]